ncbi:hypothetical protein Pcinc_013837 [Petrolisthes cinctipes]|uniref:Ionotropic glutamate receptor C-terminal domain-containing protein n=1 Tax=Petrolisthes cinctipes TaxID=88211 RepID=A0AAE1KR96_PETCI|nr:hypothetical protein Pcinc_013837 [Petrolisthes cinctipes]
MYVTNADDSNGRRLDNGSWSGSIGMVHRGEADFTAAISLDLFRYHVGEVSEIIFIDEYSAAYKRPSVQSDIAGFVKPFTPLVWVLVLVLLLMVLVAYSLLSFTQHSLAILPTPTTRNHGVGGREVVQDGASGKQEPNPSKHNIINSDAVIWTVCSLLAQSVPLEPPRGVVKSVTGLWLLLSLILATVYRSNLKAMLILPKVTLPFNNLEELVNAGLPVWVSLDSHLHRSVYFADPNSLLGGLNSTIYNAGQPNNTTWGATGLIEGVHVVVVPKYALLQVMNTHFSKTGKCSIYLMDETFMKTNLLCLFFKRGSPFKHKFNYLIRRMRESGILDHFYQRALMNITECLKPIKSEALRPLTLGDFYGIFSIYLGGLYIAFCYFLLELLRASTGS